jgi:hypothetical protein
MVRPGQPRRIIQLKRGRQRSDSDAQQSGDSGRPLSTLEGGESEVGNSDEVRQQ